jgi:ribosomal protein L29
MKEKNSVKIKDMSASELEKFIEEQRLRLIKLRFDISSKQIKNHREYRNVKRNISRALTFMRIGK